MNKFLDMVVSMHGSEINANNTTINVLNTENDS